MQKALCAAALAAMAMAAPAGAKTFRWANEADVDSLDPYVRQETFLLSFDSNIYEPLVRRDRTLRLEPALATHWSQPAPDVWRFSLRQGVAFQDGTPFGADDVLFSYDRASGPGSHISGAVATVEEVRKIDDHTVEFVTKGPDPLLPEEIAAVQQGRYTQAMRLANVAGSLKVLKSGTATVSRDELRAAPADIARTLQLDKTNDRTVVVALRIFQDEGLVETGIDDDGRYIRFKRVDGKVDLTRNERFAEGEAERDSFARFCDIAVTASASAA